MKEKKRFLLSNAIFLLIGLLCALVLCAMFYAAMAYQLAGKDAQQLPAQAGAASPAPLAAGQPAAALFPGALMALEDGVPESEQAADVQMGGALCRVITRVYTLDGGERAEVVSACPAAYLERMAKENYVPQLITGFTLAGMDAVYALSGDRCALYARDGDCVYAVFAPAGEETAYALGVSAYLEGQ